MEAVAVWSLCTFASKASPILHRSLAPEHALPILFCSLPFSFSPNNPLQVQAKKRSSKLEPMMKSTEIKEKVGNDDFGDSDLLFEELDDDTFVDDDEYFEDEYEVEEIELHVGDGSGGGGIKLAGTWWDRKALELAEDVCTSFGGDLKIYAFKTSAHSTISVRIEKMSNKYGSPSMSDIEDFSSAYRERLVEAELIGAIPDKYSLEVSSPGVERVIRIPEELDRFKDLPMYVTYISGVAANGLPQENDGIFKLISYDLELNCCTWSTADVKRNREQSGKGRPLSKKQREWRLETPFDSLRLVRLYSEC